jgi:DNA repair ATPase RecN
MKIEQLSFRIFKALTIKTDKDVYKLIELPPFDSIDALQRHKVMNVIMSLFGEHVDIVKAQVSKNDLSSLLANNIKKIMSHDVLNDSSESIHSIIPISNETMTKQSLEYNLLEHVREIDLTDYKFKSVIETIDSQTIENFEQLDNINTILNESFIDEQLNSILDDLMSD